MKASLSLLIFLTGMLTTTKGLSQTPAGKISADATNRTAIIFDSTLLLLFPTPYCPTNTARPTFRWKSLNAGTMPGVTYEVILAEMNPADTTMDEFNKRRVIARIGGIQSDSLVFPQFLPKLEMRRLYGWQVKQYVNNSLFSVSMPQPFYIVDYKLPFNIDEITCCAANLVANSTFESGISRETISQQCPPDGWATGYGTPAFIPGEGCGSPGYVRIYGNKKSGAGITQILQAPRIRQGRRYRFSACFRLSDEQQNAGYAFIKVIAFNGDLPVSTLHPEPSATLTNVGWSGKLMQKEWVTFSCDVWTANNNFDKIGIYCSTASDDTTAFCDIDKICFLETTDQSSCDDYAYTDQGLPVIDASLTADIQNDTRTYYEQNNGKLADLYGNQGYDGTTSFYRSNDGCASIGGLIPDELLKFNLEDSLSMIGFTGGIAGLDSILATEFADPAGPAGLFPIPNITSSCQSSYVPNNAVPFSGRDIIFVHGLKLTEHICARANGVPGSDQEWPANKAAFYGGGYYKNIAEDGWADHIQEWLRSRGYKNRYLVIAYNCCQRADVAAHAMLAQIRDAMEMGTDVHYVQGDPRGQGCFGKDAVIISHSTGAMITDIAMSLAQKSRLDPVIQARFGNVGFIADNMKLHIGLQGAFKGSKMATVFIAAQALPSASPLAQFFVCNTSNHGLLTTITLGSVLIDLQPTIAASIWQPIMSASPVPSLMVAGGHSVGTHELKPTMNVGIHPGLDDGVVTMGSQSANPWFETNAFPVGYNRQAGLYKVYDMGLGSGSSRANRYFLNQTLFTSPPFVGGGSTAFLSPTGMLQPVETIPLASNPENRLPNHYSFLQSASDHYVGPRGRNSVEGYNPFNHAATSGFKSLGYNYYYETGRHWEESLVITNPAVYSKGFVNTSIASLPVETVKGEYRDFDIYGPKLKVQCCWRIKLTWEVLYHVRVKLWERKYHLLSDADTECECGYVYKYVLR